MVVVACVVTACIWGLWTGGGSSSSSGGGVVIFLSAAAVSLPAVAGPYCERLGVCGSGGGSGISRSGSDGGDGSSSCGRGCA